MVGRCKSLLLTAIVGLLTVGISLAFASGAMASGPLIVGNNANFGNGPIQTYDFSAGGPPVAQFVPDGAKSDSNNGRGVVVFGNEVFYTELTNGFGATTSIEVAPYNNGAGGADIRTLPNPRPGVGIQDVKASGSALYVLTGYFSAPLQVFKLDPSTGAVLAGPINITGAAQPDADGFTILPNGNFLINNSDANCSYNQYNGTTGALVSGTTINVPGGAFLCTGVDTDGTSLFFQTNFNGFTQTDLSGNFVAHKSVTGENQGIEDMSLIHPRITFTGRAYGASLSTPLGGAPTFLSDTGEVSTMQATDTPKSLVNASVGKDAANVTASLLNADVQTAAGTPPGSNGTASAASVNITIPGAPVIHADLLSSSSRSTCTGSSGSSQITNLTIGGSSVPVGSAPNTSIPLGLLGSITVNEQTPVSGGLLVNAMHVKVLGTDVVVASARSDIHNC